MKHIEYEQDYYLVKISEVKQGEFIMDIKDLHGRFLWGFGGMESLDEAKETASNEIEILNQIEDFEDLINYL